MRKFVYVLMVLAIIVPMVLSGCQKGEALSKDLNINISTEPPTLDVALQTDTTSGTVTEMLFLGLTDLTDETVETVPELATEWSVSSDGLVWTFKMRKDVEWVHYDPATKKTAKLGKVTANDVVYGVKRMLDPATASTYAYVAYIIKGAEEFNTGESTDQDSVGVRAVDEYTVEFTLTQPAGYFPTIAGMWVCRPVHKDTVEKYGDKWTEPGNIVTNGPYMLSVWEHEAKIVLVKNPYWYDAKDVSIETINMFMINEDSTALAMYENGELDVGPAPGEQMERIQADPVLSKELSTFPTLCTYYWGFNVTKAPFDNVKVRQAFAWALDRQKLIDTVLKGAQTPATCLAPPGIFGTPAEDPNFPAIGYDPAKAKELLAEAGYPNGEGLPEITLMFNTSEGHQQLAEFYQASIREALGVEIKLANQEWNVYLDTVDQDSPQIWRLGWCLDYPDENNWVLEVFHPTKGQNYGKWSLDDPLGAKFAQLTEDAAKESDPAKRAELYWEAEKVLAVDGAVAVFAYFYGSQGLTKPWVERTYTTQGVSHYDLWKVHERTR